MRTPSVLISRTQQYGRETECRSFGRHKQDTSSRTLTRAPRDSILIPRQRVLAEKSASLCRSREQAKQTMPPGSLTTTTTVHRPTPFSRSPPTGRAARFAGHDDPGRLTHRKLQAARTPRRRASVSSSSGKTRRENGRTSSLSGKRALPSLNTRRSQVRKTRAASETGKALQSLVSWESNARVYELSGAWDWSDLRYGLNACYLLGAYATVQVFKVIRPKHPLLHHVPLLSFVALC